MENNVDERLIATIDLLLDLYDLGDIYDAIEIHMERISKQFECLDCHVDTSEIKEYYMVNNKVWLDAHPDDDGMLCIACLERRLGRELMAADFVDYMDAPVNFMSNSDRLQNRISRVGQDG